MEMAKQRSMTVRLLCLSLISACLMFNSAWANARGATTSTLYDANGMPIVVEDDRDDSPAPGTPPVDTGRGASSDLASERPQRPASGSSPVRETGAIPGTSPGTTNAPSRNEPSTTQLLTPAQQTALPLQVNKPVRGGSLLGAPLPDKPTFSSNQRSANQSNPQAEQKIYSEILLFSKTLQEAEQQRRTLKPHGLTIKRRVVLPGLGFVLSTYRVPPQNEPEEFLRSLQGLYPDFSMEFNQRYFLQGQSSSGKQYARGVVGLAAGPPDLGQGLSLAILDAAVDVSHSVFQQSNLQYIDATGQNAAPSNHGTAVASLFIGQGNPVDGAVPKADLLAINIFSLNAEGKQETRTDWWLKGLNEIAGAEPRPSVVNMSFGGLYSPLAAFAISHLASDMVFVAAAGNSGKNSPVMFPASLDEVVAVTAVDVKNRVYKQASLGEEIALSAPGVDIWVAGLEGGYYASGTSFAAPWVSAVMGLTAQQGVARESVLENVLNEAKDLGEPGADPVYGRGLVTISTFP